MGQTKTGVWRQAGIALGTAAAVLLAVGCSQEESTPAAIDPPTPPVAAGTAAATLCDFKAGPDDAAVKVVAFYPGRHEDTLEAVKALLETFRGQVQVEIVDWRRPEGLARRNATELTCAGVIINGKNAFDLTENGNTRKVLFVRGMDGEWTKADLEAAVRQELGAKGTAEAGAGTAE